MMTNENRDLLIGGIGLAFTIIGYINRQKVGRLAKSGVKVEGVVFSVESEVDVNIGSQYTNGSSRYPIIRFVTADNEWVTQKYNVSAFPGYKAGDKVTVIYNQEKIAEFILDDTSTKIIGYFFWLGILTIAVAAGLFALQL
jgi:hypothetical protein